MSDGRREAEHRVTNLELFFDLVFVFAITQVTAFLANDLTLDGLVRGLFILAALWWTWAAYAWLTNTLDPEEGGVRLVMVASMGGRRSVVAVKELGLGGRVEIEMVAVVRDASD